MYTCADHFDFALNLLRSHKHFDVLGYSFVLIIMMSVHTL